MWVRSLDCFPAPRLVLWFRPSSSLPRSHDSLLVGIPGSTPALSSLSSTRLPFSTSRMNISQTEPWNPSVESFTAPRTKSNLFRMIFQALHRQTRSFLVRLTSHNFSHQNAPFQLQRLSPSEWSSRPFLTSMTVHPPEWPFFSSPFSKPSYSAFGAQLKTPSLRA